MSIVDTAVRPVRTARERRLERRSERRRLKRLDAVTARLAELHHARDLLERAAKTVRHGWVQGAWFVVADGDRTRAVTAYDLDLVAGREVTGACLVGAVVHAGGGPDAVKSQPVQRTLDLAWHALRENPERQVRFCPGPAVRTMHVLELTYWNDTPGRTRDEVVRLLERAGRTAEAQAAWCREEQAVLARA